MLIWARTGAADVDSVVFLDAALIAHGTIECTFLLRPLNRTSAIDPRRGHERWIHQTRLFLEGLSHENRTGTHVEAVAVGENPAWRVRLQDGLPALPDDVVAVETARWGGAFVPGKLWPGECNAVAADARPRYVAAVADSLRTGGDVAAAMTEVGTLVNWGAEQSSFHPQQAMRCWATAAAMLDGGKLAKKRATQQQGDASAKAAFRAAAGELGEYEQVLRDNQQALAGREMYPYSLSEAKLRQLLKRNFGRVV